MEQQKIDLDALEAALGKATPGEARLLPNGGAGLDEDPTYWGVSGGKGYYDGAGSGGFCLTGFIDEADAQRLVLSYNALPALIAELRELRARTTPEVIGQKHQNRRLWLVCVPEFDGWQEAKWEPTSELWVNYYGGPIFGTPTHALPMPGEPEAQ